MECGEKMTLPFGYQLSKSWKENISKGCQGHRSWKQTKSIKEQERIKKKISKTKLENYRSGKTKPSYGMRGKFGKKHPNYGKKFPENKYPKMGFRTSWRKALQTTAKQKRFKFLGCYFASSYELEIALCLHFQHKIEFKEGLNTHFVINHKEIDFKISKFKCFIEVHPIRFYAKNKDLNYYGKRLKIINKSKFKDYNLVHIK